MALSQELLNEIQAGYENKKLRMISAHLYGMRQIFLEYFDLPQYLMSSFHLDHGVPLIDKDKTPESYPYKNNAALFLTNAAQVPIYRKYTNKPIHLIGALFPKYRAMRQIELAEEREGTIAFPIHSTYSVEFENGWKQYGEELKALPAEFHPITICLYWMDIAKGRHKIYEEMGFDVASCGYFMNPQFAARFYNIVRGFKYATSNEFGSYLPYAVEMGVPFFIYGGTMKAINKTQYEYYPEGEFDISGEYGFKMFDYAKDLFRYEVGREIEITPLQRKFVEDILGLDYPKDKSVIRKAVFDSQIPHLPKFLKDKTHKTLWDVLQLFPESVTKKAANLVNPYYV